MELSNVDASRLLFGFSAAFHFLFVPLTIGLMALIAALEASALWTRNRLLREAARFLSWPFLLNFTCGVLTGYPLRLQLKMHWSGYSHVIAELFDTAFAIEGRIAPVMFGLVAIFALGWRLKPLWHCMVSALLALVLIAQSSAILMINAWMQNPQGATYVDGQAHIVNLAEIVANPLFLPKVLHTIGGSWVLGGVFMMAVCAYYLLRLRHVEIARIGLRAAGYFALASLVFAGLTGHWSGERLVRVQPMKFAAIEALWETKTRSPDLVLFAWPDRELQANLYEVAVPGALGWIITSDDRPIRGLRDLRAETASAIRLNAIAATESRQHRRAIQEGLERDEANNSLPTDKAIARDARRAVPNVALVFWSFRSMLLAWGIMLTVTTLVLCRRPDPNCVRGRRLLYACVATLPMPWVAIQAGWLVCEAGRQPWVITGVLLTNSAVGGVTSGQAVMHLALAVALAALLLLVNVKCILAHLRRGPSSAMPGDAPFAWLSDRLGTRRQAPRPTMKLQRRGAIKHK